MNKKFNTPFIKAVIIILVCILFISFGLASGSNGVFDNVKMLLSAFFSSITFLLGISIAIFLSLVILTGLFLGATAIHSPEKARDFSKKLWSMAQNFAAFLKKLFLKKVDDIEHSEKLQERKEYLAKQVNELSSKLSDLSEKVKSSQLVSKVQDFKKESPAQEQAQTSPDLNIKVESLSAELSALRRDFKELQKTVRQSGP